jgi:prepilin-type N-terminal cleavage/methylation domain-containing protein
MTSSRHIVRRAFTLVEMLVVIAIIGILAALITPAIYQAMWNARQTRIKVEADQIASGFEAFKSKYGSYPPANLTCTSGAANAALTAFVARAFPRYTTTGTNSLAQQIFADLQKNGVDTTNINPQAALAFWLVGFSPDVTDPFNRNLTSITRTPFFAFDTTRLVYSNTNISGTTIGQVATLVNTSVVGNLMYNAPYGNTAFAYFDYSSYGGSPTAAQAYSAVTTGPTNPDGPLFISTTSASTSLLGNPATSTVISNGTGYLSPYFADSNNNGTIDLGETFAKPQSFQIISAGQDGAFGTTNATNASYFRLFPIGVGYDSAGADNDNITSFCERGSLDAARP